MSEIKEYSSSIDISQLATYLDKAGQIASISKMMVGVYLQDLIKGQDIANALLAKAIQADIKAKSRLDYVESMAYLDKAGDYLHSKGIKDSSEARKRYVDIDDEVMAAKDKKAQTEALVVLLKGKANVLRQSHDDLKKLHYGDQYMTGYEGM